MKEQVAQRLLDYLRSNLATEVAKLQTPTAPTNLPDITHFAAPLSTSYYLDAVVLEHVDKFPAVVIAFGRSAGTAPKFSPGTGVIETDHEVIVTAIVVDVNQETLIRHCWRLEQALKHCVPQARTDNAQPNTGQMWRVIWESTVEGDLAPARGDTFLKSVELTFLCSERETVVVTTYE